MAFGLAGHFDMIEGMRRIVREDREYFHNPIGAYEIVHLTSISALLRHSNHQRETRLA